MHCIWNRDYHSLSHTCIQLHPPKVIQLTNLAEVMVQGLCYCNSNARGWHNCMSSKWSHQQNLSANSPDGNSSEVNKKNNNESKTLYCDTADTTLTSLLRQPSTLMCSDRQHRTFTTHTTELIENSLMVDPIKSCAEINLHNPSLMPTLQCIFQCMRHTRKVYHKYPSRPFR